MSSRNQDGPVGLYLTALVVPCMSQWIISSNVKALAGVKCCFFLTEIKCVVYHMNGLLQVPFQAISTIYSILKNISPRISCKEEKLALVRSRSAFRET